VEGSRGDEWNASRLIEQNEGKPRRRLGDHPGRRLKDAESPTMDTKGAEYDFGDYHSYSTMMQYMRKIEFFFPNLTKIVRIGNSHEGRPIEGLKVIVPLGIRGTFRSVIPSRTRRNGHSGSMAMSTRESGEGVFCKGTVICLFVFLGHRVTRLSISFINSLVVMAKVKRSRIMSTR
jgi:hypothetical protein